MTCVVSLQALDEDQPGSKVLYKKLFEEDREYNQGQCHPSLFFTSWCMSVPQQCITNAFSIWTGVTVRLVLSDPYSVHFQKTRYATYLLHLSVQA